MKKYSFLFFFLSLFPALFNYSQGQCIANSGNDTLICLSTAYTPIQLGGNPTASGGSGNYQYLWSAYWAGIVNDYTASDFLDDTTSSNPFLINISGDSLTFHLTVTDDSGNACIDSVKVIFDQWYCVLGECISQISQGDTAELWPGCSTSFPPYGYNWYPNYNISDVTAPNPLVWPDTSTYYGLTIADSRGCVIELPSWCTIQVNPTSVFPPNSIKNISEIIPNPINEFAILQFANPDSKKFSIEVFNFIGKKIFATSTSGNTIEIGKSIEVSGEYFYRISLVGKTISTGKFTRN